jgi:hypothetical protein
MEENYPDIGILIDFYLVHRDFSKCLEQKMEQKNGAENGAVQ